MNTQVFEPFGTVELVQLPLDETGHCKGFGFVQVRLIRVSNAFSSSLKMQFFRSNIYVNFDFLVGKIVEFWVIDTEECGNRALN